MAFYTTGLAQRR